MRYVHGGSKDPRYSAWGSMKSRCNNPNEPAYKNYGARGIKVCERWNDFANFRDDMGPRPEGFTLERIDNDRGYEPGNCVWASRTQQSRNRRGTLNITIGDETMPLSAWVERCGVVSYRTALARIYKGWPPEEAVMTPKVTRRKCKPRGGRVSEAKEMTLAGVNLADASTASGINHRTIMKRLRRGWSLEAALTFPPRRGPHKEAFGAEHGVVFHCKEDAA